MIRTPHSVKSHNPNHYNQPFDNSIDSKDTNNSRAMYRNRTHITQETSIVNRKNNTPNLSNILAQALKESGSFGEGENVLYLNDENNLNSNSESLQSNKFNIQERECQFEDCPNRLNKIHFEELKNEYIDKIDEIRDLKRQIEKLHESKPSKSIENINSNMADTYKHKAEVLELKNKTLENDLKYANVIIQKQEIDIAKKKAILKMTSFTDEQIKYMEATKKIGKVLSEKIDNYDNNEIKILKNRISELEKSNSDLKLLNSKLLREAEGKGNKGLFKNENIDFNIIKEKNVLKGSLDETKELRRMKEKFNEIESKYQFTLKDNEKLKNAYQNLLDENKGMENEVLTFRSNLKEIQNTYDNSSVNLINAKDKIRMLEMELEKANGHSLDTQKRVAFINDTLIQIYNKYVISDKEINESRFNGKELDTERLNILKKKLLGSKSLIELKKNTNVFEKSFETPDKSDNIELLENRFYQFWSKIVKKNHETKNDFEDEAEQIYTEIQQKDKQIIVIKEEFEKLQHNYMVNKENDKLTGKVLLQLLESIEGEDKNNNKIFTSFTPSSNDNTHSMALKIYQLFINLNLKEKKRFSQSSSKRNSGESMSKKSSLTKTKQAPGDVKDILSKENELDKLDPFFKGSDLFRKMNVDYKSVKSSSLHNTSNQSIKKEFLIQENEELRNKIKQLEESCGQMGVSQLALRDMKEEITQYKEENEQLLQFLSQLRDENNALKRKNIMNDGSSITNYSGEALKIINQVGFFPDNLQGEQIEEAEQLSEEDIHEKEKEDELYYEFESENELHGFMEELIKSNRERVEELEAIIERLKESLDSKCSQIENLEIENTKIKIENDTIAKYKEEIEYLRIKIKSYELTNRSLSVKEGNEDELTRIEKISQTKEKSQTSSTENEFLTQENSKLSASIYKLANKIKLLKTSTEELGEEILNDIDESRDLQVNLSDLNPNKHIEVDQVKENLKENINLYKSQLDELFGLNERLMNENRKLRINVENIIKHTGPSPNNDLREENEILAISFSKLEKENKYLIKERNELLSKLHRLSTKRNCKDTEIRSKTFRISMLLIQNAVLQSEIERLSSN